MSQVSTRSTRAWVSAFGIAVTVAAINIALWAWANRPVAIPSFNGRINGFAYSAFQRYQSPQDDRYPSDRDLNGDLGILAKYTGAIRSYSSADWPTLPRLAREHGLKLTAGAWLSRRLDKNDLEVDSLITSAAQFDNIDRVIVGNEAVLRGDLTVAQIIPYLDRARRHIDVPVSTAEPWHIWLKYPELADHVDYIAVHLLPYWEGVARREAIEDLMKRLRLLQKRFPDKKVLIGEVGWPSNGDRYKRARPSIEDEAQFLRRFFAEAEKEKLDYFVMEAFDQPWKETDEGRVGAYWGMFGTDRELKFSLTGDVQDDPEWLFKAVLATLLAFPAMLWFCVRFSRFRFGGRLFYSLLIQLAVGVLVWSVGVPFAFYLSPFDWSMFAILLPAQLAIVGILLGNGFEFTEAIWQRHWRRFSGLRDEPDRTAWPFVSIHLACCNEPPEMVIATLDSLALLDYENFEVLVIDNNTERDEVWKPVEARCAELGPKFRFFHLRPWPGFKAGALNFGLRETDGRADVVAVVDADYVVRKDWLRGLVGYFDDPKVAIVQCPQAHRDFQNNTFRRMTNWEYEGFFRIGMHHRNERNAIIQHGTMTMIRKAPLVDTGNWAEWCICEDAELGLRLFNAGYEAQYVDEPMGRGLTPADFTAYKSQRFRWAFGAMQILRGHWDWLLRKGKLTAGQRYHFLTGWFSWFADALHLIFTWLALAWSLGMLWNQEFFSLPLNLFLVPVLGFFVCKAAFGIILYRVRVPCSWRDTLGAAVASMALSHAIARGILKGLVTKEHPFTRTAKSRRLKHRPSAFQSVREESMMFAGLAIAFVALLFELNTDVIETRLWLAILAAQSLPYLSAIVCAIVAARSGEKSGA